MIRSTTFVLVIYFLHLQGEYKCGSEKLGISRESATIANELHHQTSPLENGTTVELVDDVRLPNASDLEEHLSQVEGSSSSYHEDAEPTSLFRSTPHLAGAVDDLNHPCLRPCRSDTTTKKCHYHFKVEWYVSMSKACYECPNNFTDCLRPHCVPNDGLERPIVVVNRRLPGPPIQVCEDDEIIVDLENELVSDTTSIHWHGLHQIATPYMDGVPLLTQCPIHSGNSFRYHFLADLPGTHYWHSHSAFQRTDGMFGALIVRAKEDPHVDLYDIDNPEHYMMITDWMNKLGIDKFVNHHHTEHENKPYNILVNGLGKGKAVNKFGHPAHTPLYEFTVKKGFRHRFRAISNSIQNCPIQISVEGHSLLMITSDGHNIQPIQVESFVIYGGERWDFVVNANQTSGVYWVKYRGLLDCDDRFKSAYQIAVLRYEGEDGFPAVSPEDMNYDLTDREGLILNKLNAAPGDLKTFMTSADVRNHKAVDNVTRYMETPDYKFWLDFDFYTRDNDLFHHEDFYPFFGVEKKLRLYTPQVNNISLKLPNVPPLSQPNDLNQSLLCNETSRNDCTDGFCYCTHTLNIELGSLVELILIDTGVVYWANHPFHLHGHAFAVLGMGRLGEKTTLDAIKDLEANGKLERNFIDPPIKDTVTVPDGGYTIIRFFADNPGYWLFHCHISFHVEVGMGLVFHIGDRSHIPPVPKDFPKCGSWMQDTSGDLAAKVKDWKENLVSLELLPEQEKND